MQRSRQFLFVALVLLGAAAAGAVVLLRAGDDSLERVRTAGVLRVGYAIEAPYAMLDADGRVTGESPETARRIAARLDVGATEWVQLPFETLIPDLRERRIDVVAAGLFVTRERALRVAFSDPTVRVSPGLLVRRGNPRRLPPFSRLKPTQDVRIAVIAGSVEEQRLRDRGWSGDGLLVVPEAQAGRAALAQGMVDAIALSAPALRWIAKSSPEPYEVLAEEPRAGQDVDYAAFAFHPEDAALQRAWNRAQSGFIGSAEHLQTIAPFGFEASNLAPDVRTSEVLSQ
jgi:polar amino acid transport system substrate-binding protein